MGSGMRIDLFSQQALNSIPIPIPDGVELQQTIVAEIEAGQALVNANQELIKRFEGKSRLPSPVWGEEEVEG